MTTHRITVTVDVTDPEGDDVASGAYLDAALAYMTEVADDQHRIIGYTIHGGRLL